MCTHLLLCILWVIMKKKTEKNVKTINTPGMLFPFGLIHCLNEEKEERILPYSMN